MTQQLLTIASALIPGSLMVWFLAAIANRVFTRCRRVAHKQAQLVQVSRAIATAATEPSKTLPALSSAPSEVVTPKSAPTAPTPYETMSLAELRKIARRRGVQAIGDSRKRQSWLTALVAHQ